jgi:hypothetical protein
MRSRRGATTPAAHGPCPEAPQGDAIRDALEAAQPPGDIPCERADLGLGVVLRAERAEPAVDVCLADRPLLAVERDVADVETVP